MEGKIITWETEVRKCQTLGRVIELFDDSRAVFQTAQMQCAGIFVVHVECICIVLLCGLVFSEGSVADTPHGDRFAAVAGLQTASEGT